MKVVSDSLDPLDYTVHGILQARVLEWVAVPFSVGSSQPKDRTQVSCIADRFLAAEPQEKPRNAELGSLCLLQTVFQPRNPKGISSTAGRFFTN